MILERHWGAAPTCTALFDHEWDRSALAVPYRLMICVPRRLRERPTATCFRRILFCSPWTPRFSPRRASSKSGRDEQYGCILASIGRRSESFHWAGDAELTPLAGHSWDFLDTPGHRRSGSL